MRTIHLTGTTPQWQLENNANGVMPTGDVNPTDHFLESGGMDGVTLPSMSEAQGLLPFFGDSATAPAQSVATATALDPIWQGWAALVDQVYNFTSTQVAGAMIFGYAAVTILGLIETHRYKSESRLLDEAGKISRDLGAPRLFDLIALRESPIQNLDELKSAFMAYWSAEKRLKFHRSERADIHDWLAAPKGRGPNEGVVTMRLAYARIVRTLESKIRGFLIHLALKNSGDAPMDLQDRFVREYGEFIRIASCETAGDANYPFRKELKWLKARYDESRQALSLD